MVSAKMPEELKKKADKYGIKIGNLAREALEAKIDAIENQALLTKLDEISSKIGPKLTKQDVVKTIRSSREQ